MSVIKKVTLYLGIGALFSHELDAMTNNEWRVLPLIRLLPDEVGRDFFVLAHVPLFAVVVALIASTNTRLRRRANIGVAIFLVIHGLLHALYIGHPAYEFSSALSNLLIFGGAICGGLYIALELQRTGQKKG